MQPDGRFVVLDLLTGQPLIDRMLKPEPALKGIYVIPSRDYLVLFTSTLHGPRDKSVRYDSWPQHETASALVTGRMYSLDRQTGELLWSVPAALHQQGLMRYQPAELPVVVFARREHRKGKSSIVMRFMDKRTGRWLAPPKELRNPSNCELEGDPEKQTITAYFHSSGMNFRLKFTDEPLPPGPPEQGPTPDADGSTTLSKWLQAIQKGMQQEEKDDLFGDF